MKKTTQQFIIEARKIHGNKYDYSKVVYTGAMDKVCIICPEHGEFWQTPNKHLSGQGCVLCHRPVHDTESFIKQAKKLYGDFYDYSNVNYINEKEKITIICPLHGKFTITPNNHLNGRICPKCTEEKRMERVSSTGLVNFLEKAKEVHGDKYDYSKVVYANAKTKVCIICPEHGEFWQTPDIHLRGSGCPNCKESHLERRVQKIFLKNNVRFERQYSPGFLRDGKSFQKCDFYLPDFNIVVECQGEQHFRPFRNIDGIPGLERRIYLDIKKKKKLDEQRIGVHYIISKSISLQKILNNTAYQNIYSSENCTKENRNLELSIMKLIDSKRDGKQEF